VLAALRNEFGRHEVKTRVHASHGGRQCGRPRPARTGAGIYPFGSHARFGGQIDARRARSTRFQQESPPRLTACPRSGPIASRWAKARSSVIWHIVGWPAVSGSVRGSRDDTAVPKRRKTSGRARRAVGRAGDRAGQQPHAAPRSKDAPRTMRDLRLARLGKRKAPPRQMTTPSARASARARPGSERPRPVRGDRRPRSPEGDPRAVPAVAHEPAAARFRSFLAVGRRDYDDESLRGRIPRVAREVLARLPLDDAAWRGFSGRIRYQKLDFANRRTTTRWSPSATPSTRSRTRRATTCTTSRPSRPRSQRSSASSAGSGSITSAMRAAGGGSSSKAVRPRPQLPRSA